MAHTLMYGMLSRASDLPSQRAYIAIMGWVAYSSVAICGFACISLLLTYISRYHASPLILNAWFWTITAIMFMSIALATNAKQLKVSVSSIKWFVLLAVIAVITNYCSVTAMQKGPNTGVVQTFQMSQVVIVAIGAYFLFHQSIHWIAALGMVLVVIGLILIVNSPLA
ncbi:MAG: hypothetical protein JWL85_57 [Candidatus Saccharibacteria bacterium]|nr:hypothetical protein [Candidatus Saccharibacteria bacterium]